MHVVDGLRLHQPEQDARKESLHFVNVRIGVRIVSFTVRVCMRVQCVCVYAKSKDCAKYQNYCIPVQCMHVHGARSALERATGAFRVGNR